MNDGENSERVEFLGDLDIYRTNEIAATLSGLKGSGRIVIDCSAARYADSGFIVALMRFRREYISRGGDPVNIVLVASRPIHQLLQAAGVMRAFTIVSAVE